MSGPVRLQAGHVNIQQNCDWGLRGQTGAHGEAQYVAEVAAMASGALSAHGLDCGVWDANANCDGVLMRHDWGAVISLHCDGRDQSGFAVGVGNPTEDGAAEASKQLADALRSAYSAANPSLADLSAEYVNDQNITEYYLFNSLSPATPWCLIELGAIASGTGNLGPDQLYLMNHIHDVAAGIVNGVLEFLGVNPTVTNAGTAMTAGGQPPTPDQQAPLPLAPDDPAPVTGPTEADAIEPGPVVAPTPEAPAPSPAPAPEVPQVTPPPLVGPPPALIQSPKDRLRELLTQAVLTLDELP